MPMPATISTVITHVSAPIAHANTVLARINFECQRWSDALVKLALVTQRA